MPVLGKCCCCCELGVGGLVLGWVTMIIRLILLITAIYWLANMHSVVSEVKSEIAKEDQRATDTDLQQLDSALNIIKDASSAVFGIIILFAALSTLTSILLIVGSMKRRRMLLIPYLIFDTLIVIFWTIAFVSALINIANSIGGFILCALIAGK